MPTKSNVTFEQLHQGQAERYAKDFGRLPDIDSDEHARVTLKKLDALHRKYKQANDEQGLRHVLLTAEIALNQAHVQGLPEAERLFSEWLEKKKEKE